MPNTLPPFPCRTCARDPSDVISSRLQDMFQLFSQHFEGGEAENRRMGKGRRARTHTHTYIESPSGLTEQQLFSTEMAVKYFRLAEALYYRMLESVVQREKTILGGADLSVSPLSRTRLFTPGRLLPERQR